MHELVWVFLIFLAVSGWAKADEESLERPPKACEQIEQACGAAGYVRGLNQASDGKDLDKACLQPILKGQAVQGVAVDPATVQACTASKRPKASATKRRHH